MSFSFKDTEIPNLAEIHCSICDYTFFADPDLPFSCPCCDERKRVMKVNGVVPESEKADRFDDGKPQLQFNLLGREVQELESSVWEVGAKKYSPGNWLKGQSTTKAAGSLLRHLTAYLEGEDKDPETGLLHVGHLITCAKILANGHLKGFDDRSSDA